MYLILYGEYGTSILAMIDTPYSIRLVLVSCH